MKAIQIKFLPATNTKGSRLKAWCDAPFGWIVEQMDYGMENRDQALALAEALIKKLEWDCKVVGFGTLPNGDFVATLGDL